MGTSALVTGAAVTRALAGLLVPNRAVAGPLYAAILTLLVLGACAQQTSPAATTPPDSDVDEEPGADVGVFCDAYIEMVQASDTEEELRSLAEAGEALFDDVEANAPSEMSVPVSVVVEATRQAAAEGTPEAFMSREVSDAQNEVAAYMFDNCEAFAKLDVTAVDYAFEGVPETVPAGGVALRFSNEGDEFHEFIVFRKNDGVTESFDEILGQGDELPEGVMTFVGAANREPGEPPTVTVFQAEAGEYIALCFVPLEGDGRPHFTAGQHAEFTVEAP